MNDDDLEFGESLGDDRPAGRQTTWPYVVVVALSVLALSVAFRLPSCGESFWLDELHSAWAVVVRLARSPIGPRSAIKHRAISFAVDLVVRFWLGRSRDAAEQCARQQPGVRLVGRGGDATRREPNWLERWTEWWTGRRGDHGDGHQCHFFWLRAASLRVVMLYAVLAVWSMMAWIDPPAQAAQSTGDGELQRVIVDVARHRNERAGGDLPCCFGSASPPWCIPTSLGVLAWLVPVAFVVAWRSDQMRWSRFDVLSGIIVLATVSALATSSLPDSWERRDLWRAFRSGDFGRQLWFAWAWWPIVLLPATLAMVLGEFVADPRGRV